MPRKEYETIEAAAKALSGNWKKWDSFVMWSHTKEEAPWYNDAFIWETGHRDSDLLTQSNMDYIEKALEKFDEDQVHYWEASHWAVGHTKGHMIRVHDESGQITEAFKVVYEILKRLDSYPILDEDDWSQREYEDTYQNVKNAAQGYVKDDAPDSWHDHLTSWIETNYQNELEPRDGFGGWPSDDVVIEGLRALGFADEESIELRTKRWEAN